MFESKLIEIISWSEFLPGDLRGPSYNLEFDNKRFFNIAKRKTGSVSGKHYHKGKSRSKNPEFLFIIEGKFRLSLMDINSKEKEEFTLEGPLLLRIPPYIYHELHALTDLYFIDFNEEDLDVVKDDTVWPEMKD